MTVRHAGPQALAAERSSIPPGHVRRGPGLVDEDEARGVEIKLLVEPDGASGCRAFPARRRARSFFARDPPPGKEAPQGAVADRESAPRERTSQLLDRDVRGLLDEAEYQRRTCLDLS